MAGGKVHFRQVVEFLVKHFKFNLFLKYPIFRLFHNFTCCLILWKSTVQKSLV